MFNTKLKKTNKRISGFTLVEMVVVMGIIALIMTIGAAGLLAGRDAAVLDASAEELLAGIREAQNRAISIQGGRNSNAKAWGIYVNGQAKTFTLESYSPNGGSLQPVTESTIGENSTKLTSIRTNPIGSPYTRIAYSSPFGTPNALLDNGEPAWGASGKPTKEMAMMDNYFGTNQSYRIVLTYKTGSKTIVISKSGDSYIE